MPFRWTNNPNLPVVVPQPVIGPTEVSTEVGLVANTVNVSGLVVGTLSYNTANKGYDVVYELPSLNVKNLVTQTLNATRATINTATINTASIVTATINTANIGTATIANGILGVNPTQNLQIATKEYVDTLVANSVPLGGNLQLLIQATGDLLVGVSDNTAERLPVGTANGSVLQSSGTGNTGLRWTTNSIGPTNRHRGLYIATDPDAVHRNNRVKLIHVSEIVMNDGERVASGWNLLTANLRSNVETSGIGFLDTGVISAQTCYEIWAIRSSSNGAQGLILHRARERFVDVNFRPGIGFPPAITTARNMNYAYGAGLGTFINVSQSFIATNTGPLTSIELTLSRTGSPTGNSWITLEDNDSLGNASGVPLATSRYVQCIRLPGGSSGDAGRIRFPFDETANVVSGNSYHLVYHVDYPRADGVANINFVQAWGNIGNSYPSGIAKNFCANTNSWEIANSSASSLAQAGPTDFYFRTFVESFNTDVLLPDGYDQKCLISYASTSGSLLSTPSIFVLPYSQRDRKMSMPVLNHWNINYNGLFGGGNPEIAMIASVQPLDLRHFVPPVHCFLTLGMINAAASAFAMCLGPISATDMGGPTGGPAGIIVAESVGGVSANVPGGSLMMFGPIFVEDQAVMVRTTTLFSVPYVGEVEF